MHPLSLPSLQPKTSYLSFFSTRFWAKFVSWCTTDSEVPDETPFSRQSLPSEGGQLRSVRVPLLMFQLAKLHQKCRGCKFSNCKTDESSELNLFQRPSELMLPPNSSNKCNSSSWIFPRKFQSIIFVCLSFSAKWKVVHAKEDVCRNLLRGERKSWNFSQN